LHQFLIFDVMKGKIILFFVANVLMSTLSYAQHPTLELVKQHKQIRRAGRVVVKGEVIDVTAVGFGTSGVRFVDEYNLDGYNRLQFTVENQDQRYPLYLTVELMNRDTVFREPVKGLHNRKYTINPGEKRDVSFDFLPALPHPEVASGFRLMRNTPYSRLTQSYCYDVDLSRVTGVKIIGTRMHKGQRWQIVAPRILAGELKTLHEAMHRDEKDFFPFIDQYGQFKYQDWPGKIHSDADFRKAVKEEDKDLANHAGPQDWDRYGGFKKGPRLDATGHFRVQKVNGKWWMVDPDGYLFWSNGVVRVTTSTAVTPLHGEKLEDRTSYFDQLPKEGTPMSRFYRTHDMLLKPYYAARGIDSTYDFSSANCYRKYGEDYKRVFAERAHRRLRSWGLNTIANSSDRDICLMDKTPYIDRLEVVSRPIEGTTGWWPFMDPYDDSFNESLRQQFESRQKEVEDPWCLGFFVDNEIKWNTVTYLAETTLKAPPEQPCKQAMITWLKSKYPSIEKLNAAWGTYYDSWGELAYDRVGVKVSKMTTPDLIAFNHQIVHKYFSNIKSAFKKYAPGVMYMGCRFAGNVNSDVLNIASDYCDIISYNSYQYDLSHFHSSDIDKPIMIGEYHFGAMDRGMFHGSLIDVESQEQRGLAMERYIKSALENPNIVGVHWHQFSDQATTGRFDGENFQVGLTDCCDTPYYETISHLRKSGYPMYSLRYNP